jgi:hypothetical protein
MGVARQARRVEQLVASVQPLQDLGFERFNDEEIHAFGGGQASWGAHLCGSLDVKQMDT